MECKIVFSVLMCMVGEIIDFSFLFYNVRVLSVILCFMLVFDRYCSYFVNLLGGSIDRFLVCCVVNRLVVKWCRLFVVVRLISVGGLVVIFVLVVVVIVVNVVIVKWLLFV